MPRRRTSQPLSIDTLEGRLAPSHAVHPLAHHVVAHLKAKVHHADQAVKAQAAATVSTRAVDAGTGPFVGGTIGTGAGATLDPTSTYLAPVSAYGSQVAGNPYGGQSNSATINSLNSGLGNNTGVLSATVGTFNTLDAGSGLGTPANALVGPGLASTSSLTSTPAGSSLSGFVVVP